MGNITIDKSGEEYVGAWSRFLTRFSFWARQGLETPEVGSQLNGGASREGTSNVSTTSAMSLSAVWACVRIITETVSSLPLHLYKGEGASRKRVRGTDLARLLTEQPNEYMTAQEFRESMTMQLVLFGNAYALKHKNVVGKTISLDPLQSEAMDVLRSKNGDITYKYTIDKESRLFKADEILHLKGFGSNGLTGLSVLAFARASISLGLAADDYGRSFFTNGGKPSGILMVDKVLTKEQRAAVRDNFEDLARGDSSNRLWVLEAAMKYEPVSIPPEDAQFLATRSFQVADIARFFNVPLFLLQSSEKSTSWGSGLEQQNQAFLTYCLQPYLSRWENVIKKSLINELGATGKDQFAEHSVEGLLRSDSQARASFYEVMVRNGLYTRNECRELENMPPIEGGEVATAQAQNLPLLELSKANANPQALTQDQPKVDPTIDPNKEVTNNATQNT